MDIDMIEFTSNNKLLSKLEKNEIILYKSDRIPDGYYLVFNVEKDLSIPAIVVELWAFEGGYDHAFHRFLENDFNVNQSVLVYTPEIKIGDIKEIISYRSGPASNLTDKEVFHFNMVPDTLADNKSPTTPFPYEIMVKVGNLEYPAVLPQWTPLQQIPIDQIKLGTKVELWCVEDIQTIMKVIRL